MEIKIKVCNFKFLNYHKTFFQLIKEDKLHYTTRRKLHST